MENAHTHLQLTSIEQGKLWVTYTGNTMAKCVLTYYLRHVDDSDIKDVLKYALQLCEKIIETIKDIFRKEKFSIPIGFDEKDVNVDAPRLFSDEFYLHYLKYTSKAGMNIYAIAIPLMMRQDIQKLFSELLNDTVTLITKVNNLLKEKGLITKPPYIPYPEKVEFVQKQSYFQGFFGHKRPLHAMEIGHLYDNIENNVTSKALLIGFSQNAKNEQVQKFLLRGKELTNKHIELCVQLLHNDNLSSPPLLDDLVMTTTISPFSDKLMLWHKIDMFSMKVRSYANALSLNGRHDIGGLYFRFLMDIGMYVEDGGNIMIDQGWMEEPPQAADQNKVHEK